MKNQSTSEQILIPDYMEYFGLDVDPFETDCPAFFDEGIRGDQFAQLLHLVQFSDALLGVVGQAGLGKKTVKSELVQRLAREDVVVEVKASLLNNSYDLLCDVVENFGLELPEIERKSHSIEEGVKELIQLLKDYGREKTENDALKILLIEDAHHLDDHALKLLATLSLQELENNRSIHLVMFGECELSDRLLDLENEKLLVQLFELEPFSKEELKQYLRFRLDAVGFEGIFPYKPEDIDFLWEMSRGVPSEVHDAARDILIELASPPPESKSMGLPIPHMALIVLLLAGLLAALFYRSNTSVEPETSVVARDFSAREDGVSEPKTFQQNDSQSSTSEAETEDDSYQQIAPKTISSLPANENSAIKIGPPPSGLDDVKDGALAEPNDKIAQQKEQLQAVAKSSKQAPIITAENAQPSSTKKNETNKNVEQTLLDEDDLIAQASQSKITQDESKLMSLNDESVTLQLLAGGSLGAAESFVDRQPNKADLAIYSAIRNGKTLYIVVAGNYETTSEAKSSVTRLPDEQQKAGPWPRSLSSVKEDIREFRGL